MGCGLMVRGQAEGRRQVKGRGQAEGGQAEG